MNFVHIEINNGKEIYEGERYKVFISSSTITEKSNTEPYFTIYLRGKPFVTVHLLRDFHNTTKRQPARQNIEKKLKSCGAYSSNKIIRTCNYLRFSVSKEKNEIALEF